jgi:hypothetical protein
VNAGTRGKRFASHEAGAGRLRQFGTGAIVFNSGVAMFFRSSADETKQEKSRRRGGGGMTLLVAATVAGIAFYDPIRRFLREQLHRQFQNAMSLILGADVRVERLSIHPLDGRVVAGGVSITRRGHAQPLMTIDYLEMVTSIARVLKGELVVETMRMVRPVLRIVREADQHTNIPKRLQFDPAEAPQKAEKLLESVEHAGAALDKLGLRVDVFHVESVDGEIHYIDESAGYHVAALQMTEHMFREEGGYQYSAEIGSLARIDQPAELGAVYVSGHLRGIEDLTQLSAAAADMDVSISDELSVRVECPSIASRRVLVNVTGAADMDKIQPMLPPHVKALEPLRALSPSGRVTLSTSIGYDPNQGLSLSDVGR